MGFRFLCTSGGYPTVSQGEIRATIVKIMAGWKEETIHLVLTKMGQAVEKAQEIYAVSGGRIRLAIWAIEAGGIDQVKKWFDDLITGVGQEKIVLAVTKTDSHAAIAHSDKLRTRFINYDGNGTSLLIVDSLYAISKLKGRLDLDDFVSSFNLAGACGLQSARGWFLEEIMHLWFKKKDSALIEDWVRSVLVMLVKALRLSIAQMFIGYRPYQTSRTLMPPLFAATSWCAFSTLSERSMISTSILSGRTLPPKSELWFLLLRSPFGLFPRMVPTFKTCIYTTAKHVLLLLARRCEARANFPSCPFHFKKQK